MSMCVRRTLLLAGIATVLIFGGLSLKRLSDSRGNKSIHVVKSSTSARSALLQDPHAHLFMHNHQPGEPCGESCSKDHAHQELVCVSQWVTTVLPMQSL